MASMRLAIAATVVAAAVGCQGNTAPKPLLVSAASDLQDVFGEFGPRFTAETGVPVTFNFAATGMLAQQIKAGARVDVFAAANVDFVNELEQAGLTYPETKRVYAQGRLVAWSQSGVGPTVISLEDLRKPEFKRIAIANPVTAPYGIAASQALHSAGVWDEVKGKLVYGENVRQTLEFAKSGNVDVTLVSLSLTQGLTGKSYLVPTDLHKPINQGVAVVKAAPNEAAARRFVDMLNGAEGRSLLKKYGFTVEESDAK